MKYILIMFYLGDYPLQVEFNDLKSCQSAGVEIQKQIRKARMNIGDLPMPVSLCAAKGK